MRSPDPAGLADGVGRTYVLSGHRRYLVAKKPALTQEAASRHQHRKKEPAAEGNLFETGKRIKPETKAPKPWAWAHETRRNSSRSKVEPTRALGELETLLATVNERKRIIDSAFKELTKVTKKLVAPTGIEPVLPP